MRRVGSGREGVRLLIGGGGRLVIMFFLVENCICEAVLLTRISKCRLQRAKAISVKRLWVMRGVGGIRGGGIGWRGVRGVPGRVSLGGCCCIGCWGMGSSGRKYVCWKNDMPQQGWLVEHSIYGDQACGIRKEIMRQSKSSCLFSKRQQEFSCNDSIDSDSSTHDLPTLRACHN